MANTKYYGVYNSANAGTGQTPAVPLLIEEGFYGGRIMRMYDSFTLTADLASGDTIQMGGLLPENACLLDCLVTTGALGGSCTINVGWLASAQVTPGTTTPVEAANATGFFSALPVSSATFARAWGSTYTGTFYQKVLQAQVQPVIAENAVSSGATGLKIQMEIHYVLE